MLRANSLLAALLLAAVTALSACDDGDSTTPGTTPPTDDVSVSQETTNSGPYTLGPDCNIDESNFGKKIGNTIDNITLALFTGERYDLHANCGYDKKVVWVVLGTGWCGACEALAPKLQPIYEQYKDQGLEILWVLGEDTKGAPPSFEFAEAFVEDKGVTFPVTRDLNFLNVYSKIEQHSTALPHQYLIDANTMELINATGGVDADFEAEVIARLQ